LWRYYHYDELGSTRLLTDGSGNVTDTYSYDPWGNIASHVGSTNDNPYLYVGALGYYTHWQEPDFKLLQLGVRFFEPEIGKFTQRDPAREGINFTTYVSMNPLSATDATGLAIDPKWARKASQCIKKAVKACYSKGAKPKEYEKCFWKEMASCMGKAWAIASCQSNICYIFPRESYCVNGNACDRYKKGNDSYCQDCEDLKLKCCWLVKVAPILWNPESAALALTGCNNDHDLGSIKCDCGSLK
jgi:RHS repeat-associated protein